MKCLYRILSSASRAFSDFPFLPLDFFGDFVDFDDFVDFGDFGDFDDFVDFVPYLLLLFPFPPLLFFLPLPFELPPPPESGDCVTGALVGTGVPTELGDMLGDAVGEAVPGELGLMLGAGVSPGLGPLIGGAVPGELGFMLGAGVSPRLGPMLGEAFGEAVPGELGLMLGTELGETLGAWLTKSHNSIWAVASSVKTSHAYVSSVEKGYTEQLLVYVKMESMVTFSPAAFTPWISNCIPAGMLDAPVSPSLVIDVYSKESPSLKSPASCSVLPAMGPKLAGSSSKTVIEVTETGDLSSPPLSLIKKHCEALKPLSDPICTVLSSHVPEKSKVKVKTVGLHAHDWAITPCRSISNKSAVCLKYCCNIIRFITPPSF